MSQLEIFQFPYVFDDNYGVLLHSPETGETACIDAGVAETYQEALDAKGWDLTHILVTHHHRDHVSGLVELKENNNCKVIGPDYVGNGKIPAIDQRVRDGETFTFAGQTVRVIHTPGHTMDLVTYYFEEQGIIFVGDALFAMGCGKAFEGTPQMIFKSLQKIASLPPETLIFCSHEYTQENSRFALSVDPTNEALKARIALVDQMREEDQPTVPFTLETELATNPFLRTQDEVMRKHLGMEGASDEAIFVEVRRLRDL
ncbi:hydroxyacylglutathione hydrolase [Leucothrix sargassi]|nr:hydroxyacylglutathione hydrolase [Leucothrix sargassi]